MYTKGWTPPRKHSPTPLKDCGPYSPIPEGPTPHGARHHARGGGTGGPDPDRRPAPGPTGGDTGPDRDPHGAAGIGAAAGRARTGSRRRDDDRQRPHLWYGLPHRRA